MHERGIPNQFELYFKPAVVIWFLLYPFYMIGMNRRVVTLESRETKKFTIRQDAVDFIKIGGGRRVLYQGFLPFILFTVLFDRNSKVVLGWSEHAEMIDVSK